VDGDKKTAVKLLVATKNKGKLREFQKIMEDLGLTLVSPDTLGLELSLVEDGATFTENAAMKARAYAEASGLPTLADDSGLEVDALGGRPGVLSARYAGEGASDAERRRRLLAELAGVPDAERIARFRCAMALVWNGALYVTEGSVEGMIAREERGSGGFGYDPVFVVPELGRTMAELAADEKNAISHRGKAARAMRAVLMALLRERSDAVSGTAKHGNGL